MPEIMTAAELAELRKLDAATPALVAALKLALEYWSHRQQRYRNRCPVWVEKARAALAEIERLDREDARAAIAALDAIRAQDDGWRTMESAPNDGTEILCATPRGVELMRYWFSPKIPPSSRPTHWRPLPAAPKGG